MNELKRSKRASGIAAMMFLAILQAHAAHRSEGWAISQFAAAQRLHEALEGRPAKDLTQADYERVISAYHRVYFEAPTSTKADPSVVAEAQLLEEEGRRFDDREVLHAAIHRYEFLREQYPGSKARFGALFRIGEIYKDDLHDKSHADEVFVEFVRRYPRNQFAEEARKALAEPVQKASAKNRVKAEAPKPAVEAKDEPEEGSDQPADDKQARVGRVGRVNGIRHWSTPDYTRVAIDLEQDVKFESQRIDHPDRVFFDLYDTRLDHKLLGKAYEVNDGFLKKIRVSQFKPGQTRIVLEVSPGADFGASLQHSPPRLLIDVRDKDHAKLSSAPVKSGSDKVADDVVDRSPVPKQAFKKEAPRIQPRPASTSEDEAVSSRTPIITSDGVQKTIVRADDDDDEGDEAPKKVAAKIEPAEVKTQEIKQTSDTPARVAASRVKDRTAKRTTKTLSPDLDVREAQPMAAGDRSLIRALGLKIGKIVIDPGHGGHDTGTIGPNGLEEKDLVLDVSKRLGKLLVTRLGAEVVFTRSDDTFIPLETRTAIANQENADLFVSVHANSSRDADARGVETYYLNFSTSRDALEVAARENAVSEKSIHELQDLVKKIALKEKIEESHEFASDVERSLHSGLSVKNPGLKDRGVKKAPFIVLIGANMPSILSEISFVSNPGDERRLRTPEYRQRIAESLYRGIAKYVNGLSGVKVASKIEKTGTE